MVYMLLLCGGSPCDSVVRYRADERYRTERFEIGKVEHVRWNAYMRSEGYVCAPKNHLAKHHHNLVSVFKLSDEDLRKDG